MNWITTVTTVFQLLPSIISAIKAIEEAIPGTGKGEAKLALVRGILEAANDQAAAFWPLLEKAIGLTVATFNATGVFRK